SWSRDPVRRGLPPLASSTSARRRSGRNSGTTGVRLKPHRSRLMEANSSYLWDAELRPGNAGTWDGSIELMNLCFANVPRDIRDLRVRADAGFGLNPVFDTLESWPADYAVVARLIPALKRLLPGLHYTPIGRDWEMADFEHRPHS